MGEGGRQLILELRLIREAVADDDEVVVVYDLQLRAVTVAGLNSLLFKFWLFVFG